ncbi:MAG: peptidase S10 [Phycisphaerae bacterium]|nr:peptidase S10 [Phycisphaerae bacterium]
MTTLPFLRPARLGAALIFLAAACLGSPALARPADPPADKKDEPKVVITEHQTTIGGQPIQYKATAGEFTLLSDTLKPRAKVFYISYEIPGRDPATRPITFAFNGGPGSSSVWLHLGTIGPKRVPLGPEGMDAPPNATLIENSESWLDLTDIVFIDPVSTGFSRPVEGEDARQFHGLHEDVSAVGDFIRQYITKQRRWASPKFLAGESYGTTRAAGLSGYLQETLGINLDGIVFISPILNFQTARFDEGNDTAFWLYLPTYTATAWYHKKLDASLGDLNAAMEQSRRFAAGEYMLALAKGDALTTDERDQVAAKYAKLTGVSRQFVLDNDLRLPLHRFTKELLRDQGRSVGRLDSRYKGIDRVAAGDAPDEDPSYTAILAPYTSALNRYIREELGFESDLNYEILTGRVHPWNFASATNEYVNVAGTLRRAMTGNPNLQVLFCSGYYDLATPTFAMDYTIDHLGLDPSLRANIRRAYYESGHMMYVRTADLQKLRRDVEPLYRRR